MAEGPGESRDFFLCSFVVVCVFVNILIEASGDHGFLEEMMGKMNADAQQ